MAKIGLPDIDITFSQKAITAISRSERGVLLILCVDTVAKELRTRTYRYENEILAEEYTAENLAAIKRAFLVPVNKVHVIAAPAATDMSAFASAMEGLKYNYVCCVNEEIQQALVNYVITKNQKSKGRKYVAVVADATTADSKYVVNVKNASVHDVDSNADVEMVKYLPRLASILANLPMNRSCTYYELEDIDSVDVSFITVANDINSWIDKGYLVLFKDDDVIKIARGVNSLTTITSTDTEDMRKIIIVEAQNIIIEDIFSTFKDSYVGKYKNSYDNQCQFISAGNAYFRQLAKEEILEPTYKNICSVNVESQRNAWLSIGKTEAIDWDENKVKNMTYKSTVFLQGNIKILDAIEDLKFEIEME